MKIWLTLLVCALFGSSALADTVGVHVGSWHSKPGYENRNPGAYWRSDAGLTAGAYRNSYGRTSVYGGATVQTEGALCFALTAALFTGYPQRRVSPMLVPAVALRVNDYSVRLIVLPKPPGGSTAVVHLMLETRL